MPLLCINTQYYAYAHDYGTARRADYLANAVKALDWRIAEHNWRRISVDLQ